jgi:hypothetical protein
MNAPNDNIPAQGLREWWQSPPAAGNLAGGYRYITIASSANLRSGLTDRPG